MDAVAKKYSATTEAATSTNVTTLGTTKQPRRWKAPDPEAGLQRGAGAGGRGMGGPWHGDMVRRKHQTPRKVHLCSKRPCVLGVVGTIWQTAEQVSWLVAEVQLGRMGASARGHHPGRWGPVLGGQGRGQTPSGPHSESS